MNNSDKNQEKNYTKITNHFSLLRNRNTQGWKFHTQLCDKYRQKNWPLSNLLLSCCARQTWIRALVISGKP